MNKEFVLEAVFVLKYMCTSTSLCDLCQCDECTGVDECSSKYGDNYTFVKRFKVKRYNTLDDE